MPSASRLGRPRVLLALLVYNGREFVPRTLESARGVANHSCDVDILVLDDASPDEEWSRELAVLCASTGIQYYRNPRNLGIPRNMNLGLLWGLDAGYDYIVILNSDVILPKNLAHVLVGVAEANHDVASVTALSNNCSIYSLPNDDADRFLSTQKDVEWVSETLGGEFGPEGVEIPAAVGFCMLVPAEAARKVGLLDPVFGRGYCEELDWCLRAKAMGLRNLLAPNTFVYHMGSGSTRDAGLLALGETTVNAHEKIVDWRYPLFRRQVTAFGSSDIPHRMKQAGLRRIVLAAAYEFGYTVRVSSLPQSKDSHEVTFLIEPAESTGQVLGYFRGFVASFHLTTEGGLLTQLEALTDRTPSRIVMCNRGLRATAVGQEAAQARLDVLIQAPYPERI